MDLNYKNKVVLVTGGASGIGAGIAEVFAKEGAKLCLNYLFESDEIINSIKNKLEEKYNIEVFPVYANVTKEEDVVNMYKNIVDHFGTIDCLVNNAGGWLHKPVEEYDTESYRNLASLNVESVLLNVREFTKIVKGQNKPGAIVNVVTKTVYWSTGVNNSIYVATKAAVAGLTKSLAHELTPSGIRVNGIIPGYVDNGRIDKDGERYKHVITIIPSHEYATPADMGNVCAFLCSDAARQISGQNIDCTGGTLTGDPVNQ